MTRHEMAPPHQILAQLRTALSDACDPDSSPVAEKRPCALIDSARIKRLHIRSSLLCVRSADDAELVAVDIPAAQSSRTARK
jgi:hypothetical protein